MDAMDRFGEALVEAARRRDGARWWRRASSASAPPPTVRLAGRLARLRVPVVAFTVLLASAAVALAAPGVILTGSPVRTVSQPIATAGEGLPVEGGSRLLALRAADPAGGLPWGMRVVHTTRGLICVQIGRVYHGQLGQLGIDGAFGNDGRFHPLPPDALPDVLSRLEGFNFEKCAGPEEIYAGDIVGLQASAASNPPAGAGVRVDRREISFGLLGLHAVSITYRSGAKTDTEPVLPSLGAYLIVQRYTSGRQLGGVSETAGSDQPYPYSGPVSPNGALTAITYSYAGKRCTDTGKGRILRACGLSETPPPRPAVSAALHEPLTVRLHSHDSELTAVDVSFRAPYPITNASQRYDVSVTARGCHQIGGLLGADHDLARGALVSISVSTFAPTAGSGGCSSVLAIEVTYDRFVDDNIDETTIGTATVREPSATTLAPLPGRAR
jgi:hypothetical protein